MKLNKLVKFLPLAAAGLLLAACNPLSSMQHSAAKKAPEIAVVDMDAVAKALGRDVDMRNKMESENKKLLQQVRDLAQKLKGQLDAEKKKLGDNPSQQDRAKLARMGLEAQVRVQQGANSARQQAAELRAKLMREFQQDVRPVAAAIGKKRGVKAVVTTGFVLWYEPEVDITSEVIAAMKAHKSASGSAAPATSSQ